MLSNSQKIWGSLALVAIIIGCVICGVLGSFQSTQLSLNAKQQSVQRGDAQLAGAKDIVSQKIIAAFDLADRQLNHESAVFQALAEARNNYEEAVAAGDDAAAVEAASAFSIAFQTIVEDNPEFASQEVTLTALNAVEEAVNEIFTAFQDQQDAVLDYNTYRNSLWMPLIVGNMLGFPRAYDYYEGQIDDLDIRELVGTPAP